MLIYLQIGVFIIQMRRIYDEKSVKNYSSRVYIYDKQYLSEKTKELDQIIKNSKSLENKNFNYTTSYISYKDQEETRVKQILSKNKIIEDFIQRLPQLCRSVMYFKYISSMSNEEIARKMNYSIQRIYQIHNDGLIKLLENINKNKSNFLAG